MATAAPNPVVYEYHRARYWSALQRCAHALRLSEAEQAEHRALFDSLLEEAEAERALAFAASAGVPYASRRIVARYCGAILDVAKSEASRGLPA